MGYKSKSLKYVLAGANHNEGNISRIINIRKFKSKYEIKLFLKIFEYVKKNNRLLNQFEVAKKINEVFKDISLNPFCMQMSSYSKVYSDAYDPFKFNPKTSSVNLLQAQSEIKLEKLIKLIGCEAIDCWRKYPEGGVYLYYTFDMVMYYYLRATPQAVVQMRKRLLSEMKKEN